ncbi:MAG: SDR family NAD(P)-dependent oxidoreductase [Alphaproteobacteria bacterium]
MAGQQTALIVGAGQGLSASLARRFAKEGVAVALAARKIDKLEALAKATGATTHRCDVSSRNDVEALFRDLDTGMGTPDIVVFNASARVRGPITEIDADEVLRATTVTCHGGFLVAQQAAARMIERGSGAIFFTGASASVKGYAKSSCFAMGKFGLRGLAQAMARELQPQNIHIAHFVIDGGIKQSADDPRAKGRGEDGLLEPDAIADSYFHLWRQHRSSWGWEIELRPWVENF